MCETDSWVPLLSLTTSPNLYSFAWDRKVDFREIFANETQLEADSGSLARHDVKNISMTPAVIVCDALTRLQ